MYLIDENRHNWIDLDLKIGAAISNLNKAGRDASTVKELEIKLNKLMMQFGLLDQKTLSELSNAVMKAEAAKLEVKKID